MGMPAGGLGMHLPELIKGLLSHARDSSDKIPFLRNYGNCVELLSNSFDTTRDTLASEYAIVVEDTAAREAEDRAHKNSRRSTCSAHEESSRLPSSSAFQPRRDGTPGWRSEVRQRRLSRT